MGVMDLDTMDLEETRPLALLVARGGPHRVAAPWDSRVGSAEARPALPPAQIAPRPVSLPTGRMLSRPLALTLLTGLLLLLLAGALDGMQQYARIRGQALDAVGHVRAAWATLDGARGHALDSVALARMDAELAAAERDLAPLRAELGAPSGVVLVGAGLPRVGGRIASAGQLAAAADEACLAGRSLVTSGRLLLALSSSGSWDAQGRLTRKAAASRGAGMLVAKLQASFAEAVAHLDAASELAGDADLSVLPAGLSSPGPTAGLRDALAGWRDARGRLVGTDGWRALAPIVLGGQPLASLFAAR